MSLYNREIISNIKNACKLSHKQLRSLFKKFRRKRRRQQLAKERDAKELIEQQQRENDPQYKQQEEERRHSIALYEEFQEREQKQLHYLWVQREIEAQAAFKTKQEQQIIAEKLREEERERLLASIEKQQEEIVKENTKKNKKKVEKEEILQKALTKLSEKEEEPWHNPIVSTAAGITIERESCMFFDKTGCCKYGDRCSKSHNYVSTSRTLLIKGMYSHFSMDQEMRDDFDTDMGLEFEEQECYDSFKEFYLDVLPEFKKFGTVRQFKVCSNCQPHLRGNVYVQYSREEYALEALKNFNGRFYAGKQISVELTHVTNFKNAICGLQFRNACPKGIHCNFLHIFRNPSDEFSDTDRDVFRQNTPRHSSRRHDRTTDRSRRSTSHRHDNHRKHHSGSDSDSDARSSSRISRREGHRNRNHRSPDSERSRHSKSKKKRKREGRSLSKSPECSSVGGREKKKHKSKKSKDKDKKPKGNDEKDRPPNENGKEK